MQLVCYQPEIAQNVGALIRLSACWGIPLGLIEPLGFVFSSPKLKRAAMDYEDISCVYRYFSWLDFLQKKTIGRVVALVPRASVSYLNFSFQASDFLILGQESQGFPAEIEAQMDVCISIPMRPQARSLNVAISGAIVLSEALRQVKGLTQENFLPGFQSERGLFFHD